MGIEPITYYFVKGIEIFINCHQLLNPYLKKKYLNDGEVIPILENFKKIYKTQNIGINISSENIKEINKVNPKLYLLHFSREEALKLLNNLKKEINLLDERQKPEKSKNIQINICTTKLELKGISFEIKNITDNNFLNFTDNSNDMLSALEVFTLQLNSKNEDIENAKRFCELTSSFREEYIKKMKLISKFRTDGKKMFFDFINNDDKFLNELLDLRANIFELFDFKVLFNSGINVLDFFELGIEKAFSKAILFNLSTKAKAETINYICDLFIKLIQEKTIQNTKLKKELEKLVMNLKFLKSFLSCSLNLEISNKELIFLKNRFYNILPNLKIIIENFLRGMMSIVVNMGLKSYYESFDFDEISIYITFPKLKKGVAITFILPKFPDFLDKLNR